MTVNRFGAIALLIGCFASSTMTPTAESCCAVFPSGKPVVNADQSVIIIWDAATKTQHFIRRASFKSEASDFGFLIPSPAKPELEESGNEAFPSLQKLTEPDRIKRDRPRSKPGCGCGDKSTMPGPKAASDVKVLEEKDVAGYRATVLETKSADDLVAWLRDNGFAYSPEVAAWAKPYVENGWKITALKVAKGKDNPEAKSVQASALRMSFKTERPLFPYREPDSAASAAQLGAGNRLLRIYFIADARYEGKLTPQYEWSGKVAWAGQIGPEHRKAVLGQLRLPENAGPTSWYLTEFEDRWEYKVAPADVYFAKSESQEDVRREAIIDYVRTKAPIDPMFAAMGVALALLPMLTRIRRRWL